MDPMAQSCLSLVVLVTIIIAILAMANRIVFKMALRNFTRRKAHSAIVITGLMVGTAIISASLVVGDTFSFMIEVDTYRRLGEVDEEIYGLSQYGGVRYFDEDVYFSVSENLSSNQYIESVAPAIGELAAVQNLDTTLGEPSVAVLGLDSTIMRSTVFGDLDGNGYYTDSLGEGEVAINSRLADSIDAQIGHTLIITCGVYDPTKINMLDTKSTNLTVAEIIDERELYGKANLGTRASLFLEMDTVQNIINRESQITHIWISNKGDYIEGEKYTGKVNTTIQEVLDASLGFHDPGMKVEDVKADSLEGARTAGDSITTIFLIFSSFAIIAGVVLIINIFIMLGEERKSEMGMARAVGMKKKHLIRMFLFEGVVYAFAASAVGALLGLGLGRLLIFAFGFVFSGGGFLFDIPFYFEWDSVLIAFGVGFIITFITIFFTSRRISRLNIIRAIRRIPEPRGKRAMKKDLVLGVIFLVLGLLLSVWAKTSQEGAGWMAGPPLLALGLAAIAHKWVSIRAAITPAGLAIIAWILWPWENPMVEGADFSGFEIFLLSGVFLVLAGVIVVMFNSDMILTVLQKTMGRGKRTKAVLKIAISYPMESKLKTGMTLGMFGLIIFTVTVIAMISAMQASLTDTMLENETGGYDIIGLTNQKTPLENISIDGLPPSLLSVDIEQLETISVRTVSIVDYDREEGAGSDYVMVIGMVKTEEYDLLGVGDSYLDNNDFSLAERDINYSSDREAWQALKQNSSLCIIDNGRLEGSFGGFGAEPSGAFVGGAITIANLDDQNNTKILRVIGITEQSIFLTGIFVQKELAEKEYGAVNTTLLIELGPDEDADAVSKEFEKHYLGNGLQAFDLKAIINEFIRLQTNMMYLIQGFLGIGLLVGIAGIGIISYRNVIERRQQIGMLRAIGFRRRMITKSFLIETSFITILAIFIGVLLGIGIGWQIYAGEDGFKEAGGSFVIPWGNILAITIIAYVATLIFTFYPSLKASKVPPAEALRYIE